MKKKQLDPLEVRTRFHVSMSVREKMQLESLADRHNLKPGDYVVAMIRERYDEEFEDDEQEGGRDR